MFGGKFRSWMEAVRPRKKQQRKEKQQKLLAANSEFVTKFKTVTNSQSSENEMANVDSKSMQTIASQGARYSGANLSSPESAYSTGYSTDGTSPGAPPEYYINIRTETRYFPSSEADKCSTTLPASNHLERPLPPLPDATTKRPLPLSSRAQPQTTRGNLSPLGTRAPPPPPIPTSTSNNTVAATTDRHSVSMCHENVENGKVKNNGIVSNQRLMTEVIVVNSGLMSPRQRNRIRTNPWVPGSNLSPCNSSVGLHHTPRASVLNSPVPTRYLSPTVPRSPINRCASLSSSSCSSLSATSLNWDANLIRDDPITNNNGISAIVRSPRFHSASDEEEDDCTLNEMMGKYDESYVYEKETDILSDSDPTDCETDIDTGQDGGDEDDPETEFDFIDNGSFLEFNIKDEIKTMNTGHCTYYNFEVQRKSSSRKRTSRRSRKDSKSERAKHRSSSSKKRQKNNDPKVSIQEGTRSAGATPVSVRRTKLPISKLALEDKFRRRSNSVSIPRDPVHFFDKRDKEADIKYKELIVEAEHILKNMKCNGLSPRRVPGPPNKRVELLRTESSAKPELLMKNRLSEVPVPSTFSPRFSPKRNHITKFISTNSPILLRREEVRSPVLVRRDDVNMNRSPVLIRREEMSRSPVLLRREEVRNQHLQRSSESPMVNRRQSKTDLPSRRSPKYRKKQMKNGGKHDDSFSSDSETEMRQQKANMIKLCPQSEPVKRKIYSNQSKTVAFNLAQHENQIGTTAMATTHTEISMSIEETCRKSCESLRQQVLLNTITNLKRSLEDQSASLQQVYRSSQNLHT